MWSGSLKSAFLLLSLATGCMNIRTVELNGSSASSLISSCGTPVITGEGSVANPYLILNSSHLECMKNAPSGAEFRLDADLDLTGFKFTPIVGFKGNFDGNNHSISNLRYLRATQDSAGFFSEIAASSTIQNVTFISPKIEAQNDVGVLAGKITGTGNGSKATVSGVTLVTPSVTGQNRVSILVGTADETSISNLVVDRAALVGVGNVGMITGISNAGLQVDRAQLHGVLSASYYFGGAVGGLTGGLLKNVGVYANLSVDANSIVLASAPNAQTDIGGIVGTVTSSAVQQFYFVGTINGTSTSYQSVGSIAGKSIGTTYLEGYGAARSMTIVADATKNVNGIIGNNVSGNAFTSLFYLYQALALPTITNTAGITQLTVANMSQVEAAFSTFDFTSTWSIANAPFRLPILSFQNQATPFLAAAYNPAPTGPITMTEPSDTTNGRMFASRSETAAFATQTITLSNFNTHTLRFKSISVAMGVSYSIDTASSCVTLMNTNSTLNAMVGMVPGMCQVVVRFLPRTDVSAELSDLLVVTYEYTNSLDGLVEAKVGYKLDGFGTTVSGLIANQMVTFNSVASVTGTDTQSITITNSGSESITISGYELESGFSNAFTADTAGCGTSTLAVGASCTINGIFSPGTSGNFSKKLTIKYAGAIHTEEKSAVITFAGTGL